MHVMKIYVIVNMNAVIWMSFVTCADMIGRGRGGLLYDRVTKSYEIYWKDWDITYKYLASPHHCSVSISSY